MKHKDLGIWIDRGSGAQQWQRAAFGISALAGIAIGALLFGFLFNTKSIKIPEIDNATSIALNKMHQNQLSNELLSYIQGGNGLHRSNKDRDIVLDDQQRVSSANFREKRVTSVLPKSYITLNERVIPTRITEKYIDLFVKAKIEQGEASSKENAVELSNKSAYPFKMELNEDEKSFSGGGSQEDVIEIAKKLQSETSTQQLSLENRETVIEIRKVDRVTEITETENSLTFSTENPFSLLSYNKGSAIWTLRDHRIRNQDTEQAAENEICPGQPRGILKELPKNRILSFVTINTDKIKIFRKYTRLCINVDNL